MKILFVSDYFPPERNAPATRVYERAVYWVKWGHDVTFLTNAPNFPYGRPFDGYKNRWYQTESMDGIRVVRVKSFMAPNRGIALRILDFLSFMFSSAIAGMFQKRPDLVTATSPQFFAGLSGAFLAMFHRRPFVLEVGDLWPASIIGTGLMKRNLALRLAEKLELWMYRRASGIVALSNLIKADLVERGVDERKVAVAINGVDLHRYAPRPKDSDIEAKLGLQGKFVAAYIGTHGMAHALERIIEAAAILRDRDDIRILFVGAGAAREGIIEQARVLGLTNVVFVEEQPKEAIARYWSVCDVAIVHLKDSPVFATAIPSKIFEAMGMGLPMIISAPEGDAKQIVAKENAGIVIPAEDPPALAEAIVRLADNRELREELAARSYGAAPSYTRETQAQRVLAVYESAR